MVVPHDSQQSRVVPDQVSTHASQKRNHVGHAQVQVRDASVREVGVTAASRILADQPALI